VVPRAGTPPSGVAGRAAEIMVNGALPKSACHSGTVNGYFAKIGATHPGIPDPDL